MTVKNYLLVLKCRWIQLRNCFFYETISKKKKKKRKEREKYGTTNLEHSEQQFCSRGSRSPLYSSRSQATCRTPILHTVVCFGAHLSSPFLFPPAQSHYYIICFSVLQKKKIVPKRFPLQPCFLHVILGSNT